MGVRFYSELEFIMDKLKWDSLIFLLVNWKSFLSQMFSHLAITIPNLYDVLKGQMEKRLKSRWLKSLAHLLAFTLQNKHIGIKSRRGRLCNKCGLYLYTKL